MYLKFGQTFDVCDSYIKPNFPGRSSHICNGGFLVHESVRGMKVGTMLAETFVKVAPQMGYEAAFFNLVFADNEASIKLWSRLGFQRTGILPKAAKKSDGSYQGKRTAFVYCNSSLSLPLLIDLCYSDSSVASIILKLSCTSILY